MFPEGDKAHMLVKRKPTFSLQNSDQTWNNLKMMTEEGMRDGPSAIHGKPRETLGLFSPISSPGAWILRVYWF